VASWSVVAALLSIALLGERPRLSQLAGGTLILLGVLAVARGGSREEGRAAGEAEGQPRAGRPAPAHRRRALLAAAGSAVAFGVMVPAMGQVAPALGEFGASAAVYALGIAVALPVAWRARVALGIPPPGTRIVVLLTGLFETAGFVAVTLARSHAPMAIVAPVASLSSALTVMYAWVVLRERPDPLTAIGAVVACAGLVVLAL
jgi:drug/metabolite transporter (DMT)-like permease